MPRSRRTRSRMWFQRNAVRGLERMRLAPSRSYHFAFGRWRPQWRAVGPFGPLQHLMAGALAVRYNRRMGGDPFHTYRGHLRDSATFP